MAFALQASDIIQLSKVAWDVYRFGWDEEFSAATQYAEFGRHVKGLAGSLDVLSRVVHNADQCLRTRGGFSASLRWDYASLKEIMGDYEGTLRECMRLLRDNQVQGLGGSALDNIEWNVLVQPRADRLLHRIAQHNSKVLLLLKPLEIDLLSRVHEDLALRIDDLHDDLRRLMGILIPDFNQELAQQAAQHRHTLDIPRHIEVRFQEMATATNGQYGTSGCSSLEDLADAFVNHLRNSTLRFKAGLFVGQKVPSIQQYLNLLKCVWLMRNMEQSPQFQMVSPLSHWPSYVKRLDDALSQECSRFVSDLIAPDVALATAEMCAIWPQRELPPLVQVVSTDVVNEEILDLSLSSDSNFTNRNLRLVRTTGKSKTQHQLVISANEYNANGNARKHVETIDFKLTSVVLNPLYALPGSAPNLRDMIFRSEDKVAGLTFNDTKDLLKLQQAVTGFKAWASYTAFNIRVTFAVSGQKEPIDEDACLQLWVPKELEGKLATSEDSSVRSAALERVSSVYPASFRPLPFPPSHVDSFFTSSDPFASVIGERRSTTKLASNYDAGVLPWNLERSNDILDHLPPTPSTPSSNEFRARYSGVDPFSSPPPSFRSPVMSPAAWQPSPQMPSPPQSVSNGDFESPRMRLSSNASTQLSGNSNQSRNSDHTVAVTTGSGTTGYLLRQPVKPMLVLFTKSRDPTQNGRLSLVTFQLDEHTAPNPVRCSCRRTGREGANCCTTALERRKGDTPLDAHRFEARTGVADWNVARLAVARRSERAYAEAEWRKVMRVSIKFANAGDRARFAGTPSACRCQLRTEGQLEACITQNHQGKLGWVRETYRKQVSEYRNACNERQQVVTGTREDSLAML